VRKKKSPTADYDVGYCRPPVHTRFRKGQSGNPRGRGVKDKSIWEALRKALRGKVVVSENGEQKLVPRIEVAARQLANQAAGGSLAAISLIAKLFPEVTKEVESIIQVVVSEDDMRL